VAKTTRKPASRSRGTRGAATTRKAKRKPTNRVKAKKTNAPRRTKSQPKSTASEPSRLYNEGSLHHYQQLFHHAVDWVSLQTLDGKILDVNPAGAEMLGYEREELAGRHITEFIPPDISASLDDIEKALLRDGSKILEARNIRKDGTIFPVEVGLSLVEGPDEPLVVVHVRDITERKASEESRLQTEARFRSVLENAPDTIALVDRKGVFQFINRTVTGLSPSKVIGSRMHDYVPEEYKSILDEALKSAFDLRKPYSYEIPGTGPGGSTAWYSSQLAPVQRDGEILGAIMIARDITDRKRMEDALRQSESRLRSVTDNAPGRLLTVDRDGVVTFINRVAPGHDVQEVIGKSMYLFIPPEEAKEVQRVLETVFQTGKPQSFANSIVADGVERWFDCSVGPIAADGEVTGAVITATDITDRKQAEQAVRVSEERYRRLMESIRDGVYTLDRDGRFTYVNDVIVERSGQTAEWFLERTYDEVILPEQREQTIHNFKTVMQGEKVPIYEVAYPTASGDFLWVEINTTPVIQDGEIVGLLGVSRDITDRKRAARALQESEARFRAIVRDQTEFICRFLPDTTLTFVNDVYARAFGKTPEDLIGKSFLPLVPEEDQAQIRNEIASLDRNRPVSTHEHRVLMPDGEIRWQHWTNRALFDEEGNLAEFQSVGRDVTERRSAEDALRQSEQTARAFLNATRDLAVMLDTEGRVIMLNDTIAAALGKSPEDLIGAIIYDLFPPAVASARKTVAADVIDSRRPADYEEILQGRVFSNRVYPLFDSGGNVERLVIFATDVTDQRRAESIRREAEKSQAIAILAGGIAQNFRDVLMSMTASTTLLRRQIRDETSHAGSLDRIEDGCARISHLVDEIFSIARKLFPDPKRIQPNDCVKKALSGLSDRLPEGNRLETALAPDLQLIQADRDLVARVLSNILENAVEAVEDGGDIRILTESVSQVPSSVADKLHVSHGPFLHVHIADTGCGMTPGELALVFEPFFTTKHTGRGMGMSVAKAVIEHYGGFIFLDSEKGRGTRVHVYMPAEGANHAALDDH
jgi:PAS domain S-box-containing protein